MIAQKLILSRKGFDSTSQPRGSKRGNSDLSRPYGGVPSPIFPDGSMYSLPVPGEDANIKVTYGDLYHEIEDSQISIGQVVEDLTQNQWTSEDWTYVSPDIREPFQSNIEGQPGLSWGCRRSTRTPAKTRHWKGRPVPVLWTVPACGTISRKVVLCPGRSSTARLVWLVASGVDTQGRGWLCLVCGHGAVELGR